MSTNPNHFNATDNANDMKMSREEAERLAKLTPMFESVKNNTYGTSILCPSTYNKS